MRFPARFVLFAFLAVLSASPAARAALFEPLFMVTKVTGDAWVVRPDGRQEPVRVDHAYPYGSRIRVATQLTKEQIAAYRKADAEAEEPQVSITLARDWRFRLAAGTEVTVLDETKPGADGALVERKVLDLAVGAVNTYITVSTSKTGGAADALVDANLAALAVRTPVGEATRLSQRNQIQVTRDGRDPSLYHCQFASQSGLMQIAGPQYRLSGLKKNTVVDIDGSADYTAVSAQYGEFTAEFEKGADAVEKALFRSRCVGKIWRDYAEIGGRMAVSVMISWPSGKLTTYNYLEGQEGVGFGQTSVAALDKTGEGGASGGGEEAFPADFGGETPDTTSGFGETSGFDTTSDFGGESSGGESDPFDFGEW